MSNWNQIPTDGIIEKTVKSLEGNGFTVYVVSDGISAKKKFFELLPENSEVMNMTSVTLDTLGISKEILESGKYNSVRKKLMSMDRNTQGIEMQKLGSGPEYSVGSVHALTEDGHVLIASNSGSQLPGYVYGSAHVIWVVGAQKIVENTDSGINRIYKYTLPLESKRVQKAYGMKESFVSKLLILNREPVLNRTTIIIVKEVLGF